MSNSLLALVLGVGFSSQFIAFEHVDAIELSHFYDAKGRLIYDQVIFWDRTPTTGKMEVRSWCLVEDRNEQTRRPIKNEQNGLYSVEYYDTDSKTIRKVVSRIYRESWSQSDPERENKKTFPESLRVALAKKNQPNGPISEN